MESGSNRSRNVFSFRHPFASAFRSDTRLIAQAWSRMVAKAAITLFSSNHDHRFGPPRPLPNRAQEEGRAGPGLGLERRSLGSCPRSSWPAQKALIFRGVGPYRRGASPRLCRPRQRFPRGTPTHNHCRRRSTGAVCALPPLRRCRGHRVECHRGQVGERRGVSST